MTVPGPLAAPPGKAGFAGRPAGALLVLLVVGLLALLPCAGTAHAASGQDRPSRATTLVTVVPQPATHSAPQGVPAPPGPPLLLCTAGDQRPEPRHGCASTPYCGQESHLPNAPPQPAGAVPPRPLAPRPLSLPCPPADRAGDDLAPDLHQLQVQRS